MQRGSCVPLFTRATMLLLSHRASSLRETRFSLLGEIISLEYLRMDFDNWIILSRKRLCDFTGVSVMQG